MNSLVEFGDLSSGRFLKRYKRFFVDVEREGGSVETVHCANTGSMKSCLQDSCTVYTSSSSNPDRKLKSSLELMHLEDGLACLNTARANHFVDALFEKFYRNNEVGSFLGAELFAQDFSRYASHKREAKYSAETRFDFQVKTSDDKLGWIEVKSVSLRLGDNVAFPDAVTERGQKHIQELMTLSKQGDAAFLFFVVMRGGSCEARELASSFRAAYEIDPKYAELLRTAVVQGVQVRVVVPSIQTTGFGMRAYAKFEAQLQ